MIHFGGSNNTIPYTTKKDQHTASFQNTTKFPNVYNRQLHNSTIFVKFYPFLKSHIFILILSFYIQNKLEYCHKVIPIKMILFILHLFFNSELN